MDRWSYPTSLTVSGREYSIRTNYGAVLDLFIALNDPDMVGETEEETNYIKSMIIMQIMFPDYESIPYEHWQEAIEKVFEFINSGISGDKQSIKTMDWEQDAPILIPEINKILGYEVRNPAINTHWWTFLGAYMGISESLFSNVVRVRYKKAKGKKLDKYEQEFYKENKSLIDFEKKNQRSEEEKKILDDYFCGYKRNKKASK